ncbi:MAG TPA: BamA/TamA family outer membrane protein [Polyangiaceae bacterium]
MTRVSACCVSPAAAVLGCALCFTALAHGAPTPAPSRPDPAQPSAEQRTLTTETWREPEVPVQPHLALLYVPEMGLRLVLTPLLPVVAFAEAHRVDRRIHDFVTNRERTALLLPVVVILSRDGAGAGLRYKHTNLRGSGERLELAAVMKTNLDREVSFAYAEKLPTLDGRSLGGQLLYDVDHNDRYYGIGNDTHRRDERLLAITTYAAQVSFELGGPATDLASFGSDVTGRFLREGLAPGTGHAPGVQASDDAALIPPAFQRTIDYAELSWFFRHDLRDTLGRTHRGTLFELDLHGTSDLNGEGLNAAKATGSATGFIPVAPMHRVFVLSLGVAGATPWSSASEIPLHTLPTLGRTTRLRGYAKGRFRDRAAWWSTVEYRYPVFDFDDTGVGLSSTLFVDVGRVGGGVRELTQTPVRVSAGAGLRGESAEGFIFRGQVGFSEEGVEFTFTLNDAPP